MWASLLVLFGLSFTWAQSCCSATGSNHFAVVGRCQKATIATALQGEWPQGSIDKDGIYHQDKNQDFSSYRLRLGGGWKWTDSWQTYASTAIESNFLQDSDQGTLYSIGFQDLNLGTQYTLFEDALQGITRGHWIPFWDVFGGWRIPTGKTQAEAKGQLEKVHGPGDWTWHLGSRLVKFISPLWATSIEGSYSYSLEKDNDNPLQNTFQKGDSWNTVVGLQYIPSVFWSIGSTFSKSWIDAPYNDGKQNPDEKSEHANFSLYGIYVLSFPRLEANLNLSVPARFTSRNIPNSGPSIGLGINWNFLPSNF